MNNISLNLLESGLDIGESFPLGRIFYLPSGIIDKVVIKGQPNYLKFKILEKGSYYDLVDSIENISRNLNQELLCEWENSFGCKCSLEVFESDKKIMAIFKNKGFYNIYSVTISGLGIGQVM
jgi:hypothetical protein